MNKIKKLHTIFALFLCLMIMVCYFLFNLKYLSKFIDSDIYAYTNNAAQGHLPNMFNPHHLMFDYGGYLFFNATKNIDNLGVDIHFNQKIKALLISSIVAGLTFLALFFLSKRIFLSLIITAFITFSRGYIGYAHINDTPIIHSSLCVLLFFLLYYYRKVKRKRLFIIGIGVFHAFVVFFHQSNVIFYPVIAFYILACSDLCFKKRLINLVIYSFTLTLLVFSTYLYVGLFIIETSLIGGENIAFFKIKGTGNFFNWLSFYVHMDVWGRGHEGAFINKVFFGFTSALSRGDRAIGTRPGYTYYLDFENFFSLGFAAKNISFILIIVSLVLFIFLLKRLYKKYGPIIGALLIWLVVYAAFFSWWEPEFFEFWVITVATFFIITFFVVDYLLDKIKERLFMKYIGNFIAAVLLCGSLIVFIGSNYFYLVYKRSLKINYGFIGKYKKRILKYNGSRIYR